MKEAWRQIMNWYSENVVPIPNIFFFFLLLGKIWTWRKMYWNLCKTYQSSVQSLEWMGVTVQTFFAQEILWYTTVFEWTRSCRITSSLQLGFCCENNYFKDDPYHSLKKEWLYLWNHAFLSHVGNISKYCEKRLCLACQQLIFLTREGKKALPSCLSYLFFHSVHNLSNDDVCA